MCWHFLKTNKNLNFFEEFDVALNLHGEVLLSITWYRNERIHTAFTAIPGSADRGSSF